MTYFHDKILLATGGLLSSAVSMIGTMKVDSDYLYVVASVTDGVPLWKKVAPDPTT